MSQLWISSLPLDLFSPDRLPARDENGMCWHPDYDLIYNGLGVDDEGEAAAAFLKDMGFKFCCATPDDEFLQQHDNDGDSIEYWNPDPPEEGLLLLSIDIGEDGPIAWYVWREQEGQTT
jgi:hypothetical protein